MDVYSQLSAGRTYLEASMEPGLTRPVKRSRLEKAAHCFRQVMNRPMKNVFPAWAQQDFLTTQCSIAELLIVDGFVGADVDAICYAFAESSKVLRWQHSRSESTTQSESRFFHLVDGLRNPVLGRASLRHRVFLLQSLASQMTADEEQLVKKLDAVKLECFIGILELVRHAASQNLASDKPDRAKALLDSEAEPLGIATDLEARVWNRVDGREQAVAAAAGRIRGRAEGLKREYNKLLGVCEGAILLHTADARRAEATEGLSSEELLKREELAAEDYDFALKCVQSNNKELEGALLVRLAHYHFSTTKVAKRAFDFYTRAVKVSEAFYPALPAGTWYHEAVEGVRVCGGEPEVRERPSPGSQTKAAPERPAPDLDRDDEECNKQTNGKATRPGDSGSTNGRPPDSTGDARTKDTSTANGTTETEGTPSESDTAAIALQLMRLESLEYLADRPFCDAIMHLWPPKGIDASLLPNVAVSSATEDRKSTARIARLALLKMCRMYHPDRNSGYGEVWKAVTCEICKALTNRLQARKDH